MRVFGADWFKLALKFIFFYIAPKRNCYDA